MIINENQQREQDGLRIAFSTINHLLKTVSQVIESVIDEMKVLWGFF